MRKGHGFSDGDSRLRLSRPWRRKYSSPENPAPTECPQKRPVYTPAEARQDGCGHKEVCWPVVRSRMGQQQGPEMVKVELEEDHPRDQALSLPEDQPPAWEIFRQQFKHFCYQRSLGPREALSRLRELCRQWLRPETHSKEQIVELLVREQFLTILPEELQAWVQGCRPGSGEQAVTVLEDLERELDEPQHEVVAHTQGQEVLSEETVPLGAQTSPSLQSGLRNPSSPMTLLSSPTLLERQLKGAGEHGLTREESAEAPVQME
uniref:zinc finger and SCAN domain-containing protein 12-like n=1 Tax=Halichoerus grypus TaxID=9711 RepID=UPI001659517B|nr:zinc finger and SCAN domain-containing protein 12-like [Halichoerus grypus]